MISNNGTQPLAIALPWCVVGLVALWLSTYAQAAPPEVRLPEKHRAFFETHCIDCHDSETREGKVDLEALSFHITTVEQAELWQKVLNALNAGEMPPEGYDQPGNTEKADFLDDLARIMVTARQALSDSGGKITMRRLNRREYRNTIEQLTGAKIDVDSLPADGGSGTFDTVGASQFISSDQFEQYLKLGRQAIDEAFERRALQNTKPKIFRVEPETTVNVQSLKSLRQMEETYERYLRWKAEVDQAALAPENQKVIEQIREKYKLKDLTNSVRFYQNADLLKGGPDAKKFGFRDANAASFSYQGGYGRKYAYLKHYAELPHSDRGTYLKLTWGIQRIDVSPKPKNLPLGTYSLRVRAGVVEGTRANRHFIEIGHPQRVNQVPAGFASLPISSHQVTGTIEKPEVIETRLEVGLLTQKEFGIQERQPTDGKSLRNAYNRDKRVNGYGTPPAIWIDWIELEGPLQKTGPPSPLRAILKTHSATAADSETERARAILSEFAEAAFRQANPDATFIDKLLAIFEARRKAGDSFELAIRTPLSVILASPGFLYLYEPVGAESIQRGKLRHWTNTAGMTISAELIALDADAVTLWKNGREYRIPLTALSEADRDYAKQRQNEARNQSRTLTDRELAVRLAYFLWSAPPDHQLLELASRGELHKPVVLRNQVERMIADPRSDDFVTGFVHQWLDMERLDFFQFDVNLHRDFDESTRAATREEVYQSFAHLLRDSKDGRLGKLLKSDYVFVNGLLATYYGIEGVAGDEFRKIKLPADSPRGGLLGMAAIHAMGSDGIVSSPVERGAWVLRHLLNDPPPPAPPNVPQISRLEGQILTTRERLLAHQEEAQCASCHRKIDPIGFGLENFDAAGKWRTEDSYQIRDRRGRGVGKRKTWTIDASGVFHKGPVFSDYHELRDHIADREEDFAHGFTEHLIEYALGRSFGFTDADLAIQIVSSARRKQFAVSEFVHAIVQSKAFRTK